ncbi:putative Glycosyl transferase, family 2 [Herminiimonas arsenicoxydans]|uniref:Glycosyl transferase, family 2 n=1 Tax=Herminiimonas arsenicoxydans TaxID=204773 RepID=A4G480_HERAR|nr:putative Glycosyl transferase, family 2 [Herminiimonas arsenicoxydans]
MNDSPVVTVVIPTYNHAHFLREALQSLCAQSFSNWEAIVVNNYSEDDTIAVVASFSDPRIRLENFRNNGVIASSRNRGIALAQGQYIAFLDSDDIWYPEKLTQCMQSFDDNVDLVCHGLYWFGNEERNMFCGPAQRATFDALLDKGNCITPSATVVRKSILDLVDGFSQNPAVVTSEDYHLWLKLAKVGARMKFLEEILGGYRIHSSNQSSAALRHLESVLQVVEEFFPAQSSSTISFQIRRRKRLGLAYYSAGRVMQKNGKRSDSRRLFLQSIKYWPFYPKIYLGIVLSVIHHLPFVSRTSK